jgi:hypothetical protein
VLLQPARAALRAALHRASPFIDVDVRWQA